MHLKFMWLYTDEFNTNTANVVKQIWQIQTGGIIDCKSKTGRYFCILYHSYTRGKKEIQCKWSKLLYLTHKRNKPNEYLWVVNTSKFSKWHHHLLTLSIVEKTQWDTFTNCNCKLQVKPKFVLMIKPQSAP